MKGRGFVLPTREAPEASHAVLGASRRPSSRQLGAFQVLDQRKSERCGGYGTMQGVHLFDAARGVTRPLRSPTFLWWLANRETVTHDRDVQDRGVDPYALVDAAARFGAPELSHWDPPLERITERPPDVAFMRAQRCKIRLAPIYDTGGERLERILDALAADLPVLLGVRVDEAFEQDGGPREIGPIEGAVVGNHMICAGGYTDARNTVIGNSWGLGWRTAGTAELTPEFIVQDVIWCATLEVLS